jgi:hypothetical protein
VSDALGVSVGKTFKDRSEHVERLALFKGAPIGERAFLHELHHQERRIGFEIREDELDNVRMLEGEKGLRLAAKGHGVVAIVKNFHGAGNAHVGLASVDGAEAADTELSRESKSAETLCEGVSHEGRHYV